MFIRLRLLALVFLPLIVKGQTDVNAFKKLVSLYLQEKKVEFKLTDKDINDWSVSSCYTDSKTGLTYLYLQQEVDKVAIFNAISPVAIKNGKVFSFSKNLIADAVSKVNISKASISPSIAIDFAAKQLDLTGYSQPVFLSADKEHNRYYYRSDLSKEKITVELVYQPYRNALRLAYNVNIRMKDNQHWWNMRIDAMNGNLLSKNDWTVTCDFGTPAASSANTTAAPLRTGGNNINQAAHNMVAAYRVYPLPVEAPSFGSSVLLSDPSDPGASPFGWHDTDGNPGAEFNITRGNNVFAYDDIAAQDAPGTSPNGGPSLTFDFPVNFTQQPAAYLDASNTNLFYTNNTIHDILFHYGFDEAAGNFQQTNYSGNGNGNDYVVAECQDGGGTNNANFSTPDDGQNGWMQMYLWAGNTSSTFTVNSPAGIAGSYSCVAAGFGPVVTVPVTANIVIADDGTGTVSDACDPLINGAAMAGKIALIDRGTCNFADKVLSAQNAGAVAAIVVNNTAGAPFAMGGNANSGLVNIPSVMISQADGNLIRNTLNGSPVNATLNPTPAIAVDLDGSLDNGIVMHEFGHGVSNRLTGGPMNSNCLANDEQGGEGWSDYFALLFTIKPGDTGPTARGMGTYALGEPTNGLGIRRYPYSTNMAINPQTYGDLAASPEAHDIGEIWCVTLWDMTWALINQYGYDPDWIHGSDTTGNHIALSLVLQGMKLQICNPGFLDARDGILQADDLLYNGVHKCLIWDAFSRRGMGFSAVEGSSFSATDQTEAFDLPPLCMIPTAPPVANFNTSFTTSCFGEIHFTDLSTSTPQGWHWNFGDGDTSVQQNPVHVYTTPGVYTVTLIVNNTLGRDTLIRTNYITITTPAQPTVSGDTVICSGFFTTLTASGITPGNVCEWRDLNDSVVFTGTVFNTPVLNTSTTYNVVQYAPTAAQHVGPVNNNIGLGGYHNSSFEGRLFFTTTTPVRINSVWVDANGSAIRNINLFQNGTQIQQVQQNIPDGQSRVTLNMEIPNPGNYEIGVSINNNLYRNTAGASYPYTIPGLLSITGCNALTNPTIFYYYLYDWDVQELPCTNTPRLVTVDVNSQLSSFTFADNGLSVTFNSTGAGAVTWAWDFGNGQTSNQPGATINYANPGNYTVSLTTTDASGCQSVTSHLITVTIAGISQIDGKHLAINYDAGKVFVRFDSPSEHAKIRIYDSIGKLVINDEYNNGLLYSVPVAAFASGFMMVEVDENGKNYSQKIVIAQ